MTDSETAPASESSTQARSINTSPFAIVLSITCVALIVAALVAYALRWRESGWGALVWLASFIAMFAIRTPHTIRNRANVIVGARKGLDERLLLLGMFATMMALPLLHLATGVFVFADYELPAWATWTGALLQIPFLWLSGAAMPTWAATGVRAWKCARNTSSSPQASTSASAIPCMPRSGSQR